MWRYLTQRLLGTIPVIWGVVTLCFVMLRVVPGDPAAVLVAQAGGTAEDAERLRAQYGLDRPLPVQYVRFLWDLMHGDLGHSLYAGQPVSQIIAQQAPATIALATAALGVSVVVGLALGVAAAVRQGTWIDALCVGLSSIGVSVPVTLSGLVAILLFALVLPWLPATGQGTPRHLVLPACVMGVTSAGSVARLVRAELVDALGRGYVTVARAKGLSERTVLVRHALRNALVPVITVIGLQFGFMLGGAVATESVFARQGLGRTLVDAILYQDYPVVQGVVIVSAALYSIINLTIDLAYGALDPRIHRE
jgi:ABC-type dipeptide/oligopeptide/nickel transport system permease component